MLSNWIVLDQILTSWLREDIGRGDQTTQGLGKIVAREGEAVWLAKADGIIAGLPVAERVFYLLEPSVAFERLVSEGEYVRAGTQLAEVKGPLGMLLSGERVALNLTMRLSGIATATQSYVQTIADLPAKLVDTRKTTPGLRILEKYATSIGGACNHRMGLDDAVMIKDNHIAAAGDIRRAVEAIRANIPYPLTIEIETETLEQVDEALICGADSIMLDNMPLNLMKVAVEKIRATGKNIKIEASGNVTLKTLRAIAETGVDYISSSAPITQAHWLDISMRINL